MGITLGDLIVKIRGDQADLDRDLKQAEGKVQQSANNMGGFFQNALSVAVGGAILSGVKTIGNAIIGIGSQAFDLVAGYERAGMSIQTMLAREIQKNSVQTKSIYIGQKEIEVTEGASKAKLRKGQTEADLALDIAKTTNQIAIQNANLNAAIAKGKESADEIEARRLRIQGLEGQLQKLQTRQGQEGTTVKKTVAIYKQEKTQAIDLITARKMAAEETQNLLKWTQKVGIQSPFSQEDVLDSFKMAMTYGFTSKEAQRLTMANINLASATGLPGPAMARVSLALGQMRGKAKLAGQEMLQLTEAGIPMREILIESGKFAGLTAENFDKKMAGGVLNAKLVMEAYTEYVEKNFNTAAKDQASSLSGLSNSIKDIGDMLLRVGFEPIFKGAQPYLDRFVAALQNPALQTAISGIGTAVGNFIGGGLGKIERFFSIISENTSRGVRPIYALRLALLNFLPPEFGPAIDTAAKAIDKFQTSFAWSQDAGYAIRQAIITAFGPDVDALVGPILGAVFSLPSKAAEAFKLIKEGKWGELLNSLWGDLGMGSVNVADGIAKLIAKLTGEAQKEDTIKKAGDAFFTWGAAALRWIDEKISSEDFQTRLTGVVAKLGTAAGNLVSSIASAFGGWVAELAGFPNHATPEQMQTPLNNFINAWAKMVATQKDLGQKIGKAFWMAFFEGIGATAPTAEELSKLAMNPLGYATEAGTKIGNNLTGRGAATPENNRFVKLTKDDLIDSTATNQQMEQVGVDMAAGIQSGFRRSIAANIAHPQNDFEVGVRNVINGIMDALGIHSPSTVTAEQIGVPMAQGIGEGFLTGVSELLNVFDATWQIMDQSTMGWPEGFAEIGRRMMGGLIAGIKERAADVKAAIINILPPAIQAILKQMGIASPSKVMMGIGKNMMDGLALGITDYKNTPKLALTNATGAFAGSGGITVNMNDVRMGNDMDVYMTAYAFAKRVKDNI